MSKPKKRKVKPKAKSMRKKSPAKKFIKKLNSKQAFILFFAIVGLFLLYRSYAASYPSIACPLSPKRSLSSTGTYKDPGRPSHAGIDMGAPVGTPLYASQAGNLSGVYFNNGYGNNIEVTNSSWVFRYAHIQKAVRGPGPVKQGELIGYSGNSQSTSFAHLHYEIRKKSSQRDFGFTNTIDPKPSYDKCSSPSNPQPSAKCPDKKGDYSGSHPTIKGKSTNTTCVHHLQYLIDLAGKYDNQKVEAAVTYTETYDSVTLAGVKNYQKRKKISLADGTVGSATWDSLHRLCKYINDHPKNGLKCSH